MTTILKFDSNQSTNIKFVWTSHELVNYLERDQKQQQQQQQQDHQQHQQQDQQQIQNNFYRINIHERDNRFAPFNTEFSHNFFKEEQIMGYDPLRLNIFFTAGSLYSFIDTNYTIKSRNITNVEKQITGFMSKTDPPFRSINQLQDHLENKEKDFVPVGVKLKEYTIVDREIGEEMVYEIYFGRISDPAVLRYHERLQIFCLWFIDASSFIHSNDTNWDVFFIFEKRMIDGQPRYGIAGYCTLYNFYHHPSQTRPRISQFLVLPPYQRMGHGKHLFNSIYNYYLTNDSVYGPCYDLTVEDPGEQFSLLRNTVDLGNIMRSELFKDIQPNNSLSLSANTLLFENIRKKLLISPSQSKICLEIYLLSKLMHMPSNSPVYKNYRISIKKKLYKQYIGNEVDESIKDDPAKLKEAEESKKKILLELYRTTEQEYCQTIQSLGL